MCSDTCQPDAPRPLAPAPLLRADGVVPWSDICADQADGFAWLDADVDPAGDDLDDDRGYGHGV